MGGEVNHMPANSATQNAGGLGGKKISKYKGLGILMDVADHQKTASWGSFDSAVIWR
ncbi:MULTISPECIES: hypothetical protein [Myroides]|uniref:Uncharacterized protein n=1 Tax=Myroides albus TaxID=2562892 RepID=A0A6I3LSH2_9FLAO|nr:MULTISPECIES: hypothetical protein [Myroides]MTG99042.1 hypothetical protein [Myroides albus]MVX35686.1 hypothetical protein [Myroides sp. LoEW2-1]UVD80396.1 hypothetical protein NWE55_03755 [Myroides albus]UVD80401.1 hypothetical protein NWE55_03795 [Myroides albus]